MGSGTDTSTSKSQSHAQGVQGHTLWSSPWRIDNEWPDKRRARILDADGNQVMRGMNHAKAEFIVTAVNRDVVAQDMLVALKRLLLKYQNCALSHGNSESVVADSTEFARAAIAKAEGR